MVTSSCFHRFTRLLFARVIQVDFPLDMMMYKNIQVIFDVAFQVFYDGAEAFWPVIYRPQRLPFAPSSDSAVGIAQVTAAPPPIYIYIFGRTLQ